MPLMSSPARRVLGEKDTNAPLNIASPQKALNMTTNPTSTRDAQRSSRILSEAIQAVSASPRGQKRRIIEVEGVEARDWDEEMMASQTTDFVSDSASEAGQLDTSMMSANSAADTTMTSFGVGESQENLLDQHFDMLEPAISQRTLDKIHAITLPQNASQPSQLRDRPQLVQNMSQDSVGMSNFINLHSEPSSQASDVLRLIDVPASQPQEQRENAGTRENVDVSGSDEARRRAMMDQKAAQLRTRLQLAFFKVETRQTNTPFSRLKVPESYRASSETSPLLSASSHRPQSHSVSIVQAQAMNLSPETRIAARRAEATMQHKPAVKSLSSLPFPQMQPTAFSARWADQAPAAVTHSHPTPQQFPSNDEDDQSTPAILTSSPPMVSRTLHIHEDETATASRLRGASLDEEQELPSLPTPETPAAKIRSSAQPSSPFIHRDGNADNGSGPEAVNRDADLADSSRPRERRLTSSVVKGEAASGLLQLMRSGAVNVANLRGPMCGL